MEPQTLTLDTDELRIEIDSAGVATIWIDQPGKAVNTISPETLGILEQAIDEVVGDPRVQAAVLISAKEDNFIAGADLDALRGFDAPSDAENLSREGHRLLGRVRQAGKPLVAAIHGPALGGGLEVALGCSYRIATEHPKTKLALPEVQLGLVPAGAGTQHLPRLIGLQRALPLLLTGKNVYPKKALRIGLVDALIHKPGLHHAAKEAARGLASGAFEPSRDGQALTSRLLESTRLSRRLVYRQAEKQVQRDTRGNYPAPFKILECVQTGLEEGLKAGLDLEAQYFGELAFTPESQALVGLFFSKQKAEKNPMTDEARPVETVAVLGAGGLMGAGIAEVSARNGHDVMLKDQSLKVAARGRKVIWEDVTRKVGKGVTAFERDQIMERARLAGSYEALAHADLVIEAVPEELDIKHEVLTETEQAVSSDCVIASNTSSLPITDIAEALDRPENVVGMHYFSPVPSIPLLEVIRGEETSDEAVATAIAAGLQQGKTVIVVDDGPGFYTTRILALYMNEALLLLEEGASIDQVDETMMDFGFPMGPYELFDLVGIPTAAKITTVMGDYAEKGRLQGDRDVQLSDAAQTLVRAGLTGQKEKGFYTYEQNSRDPDKESVNEEVYAFFGGPERTKMARQIIEERLALMMASEAVRCLEEGILSSAEDGDLGAVFGLGFPPFRGGPFRFIDREGADNVVTRLQRLAEQHGERFQPPALLKEKAEKGETFRDEE